MILSHLEDIKAKIQQKSINNIKLPFEGPLKDKYSAIGEETEITASYFSNQW